MVTSLNLSLHTEHRNILSVKSNMAESSSLRVPLPAEEEEEEEAPSSRLAGLRISR